MQKVLDLCSGIGGFTLAAKIAGGFETIAFCDADADCRNLLSTRFPNTPIFEDIKDVSAKSLQQRGIEQIDGITAGLPCPPFSSAGKKKAEEDPRNLFPEYFRILREVRPRWSIIENVRGLITVKDGQFFKSVLREIAASGYDAEWHLVSAADIGAVHQRDRVWIILWDANPNSNGCRSGATFREDGSNCKEQKRDTQKSNKKWQQYEPQPGAVSANVTNSDSRESRKKQKKCDRHDRNSQEGAISTPICGGTNQSTPERSQEGAKSEFRGSNDGIPSKLDRCILRHDRLNEWLNAGATIPYIPRLTSEEVGVLSSTEQAAYKAARAEYQRLRKAHTARIKQLGNSIVPQCAAIAFKILKQRLNF